MATCIRKKSVKNIQQDECFDTIKKNSAVQFHCSVDFDCTEDAEDRLQMIYEILIKGLRVEDNLD